MSENWQHYTTNAVKRKRAELVCIACHAKKIKCDLLQQRNQGHEACKNCFNARKQCHIRPSKREKRRRNNHEVATSIPAHSEASATYGVDALLAAHDATFQPTRGRAATEAVRQTGPSPQGSYTEDHRNGPPTHHISHLTPAVPVFDTSPRVATSLTDTTPTQSGDVDAGFLQVYAQENQFDAENQALVAQLEHKYCSDISPDLQHIFTETYFEFCYTWCPVLDRSTLSSDIVRSPLLANSLALAGSHIQPPLLPHHGPDEYYKRARTIFYNDEESDELMTLKSLCLFYWWAPQSPSRVHRHSSWWWTSVIIRHAQQMRIHREPSIEDPHRAKLDLGLRRRIWWTAFARERLTSLCQSKPAIIDPDDCNIQEPSLSDFPPDAKSQHQGEIFIYWVRLCAIIGRIAKYLLKSNARAGSLQNELREELVNWVHSLPPCLKLPIDTAHTSNFDRDVHQLHLFYLTTIIILHLKRSGGQLPQALPPAILAASCTARILRDILARGNSRFLMAITCWHSGTAFVALLQACRIAPLRKSANEDLDILSIAVKELQKMWASANVVAQGFERLRKPTTETTSELRSHHTQTSAMLAHPGTTEPDVTFTSDFPDTDDDDFDWMRFFPFVSKATGGIAEQLVSGRELGQATRGFPSPNNETFYGTLLAQFQDLFDPFMDFNLGYPDMNFEIS